MLKESKNTKDFG
jgi:hypothetical protein